MYAKSCREQLSQLQDNPAGTSLKEDLMIDKTFLPFEFSEDTTRKEFYSLFGQP
jgi:hypothetical protein